MTNSEPECERAPLAWPRPGALRMAVSEPHPGIVVVAPSGEVDLATASLFRDVLGDAADSAGRCVLADLSGLAFCGSTGLVVLIETRQRAADRGVGFRLAAATPAIRRLLEITGLGPVLGIRGSVDAALAELAGADLDP